LFFTILFIGLSSQGSLKDDIKLITFGDATKKPPLIHSAIFGFSENF
jgi:hypothetical protein